MPLSEENLNKVTTDIETAFSVLLVSIHALQEPIRALSISAVKAYKLASDLPDDSPQKEDARSVSDAITSAAKAVSDATETITSKAKLTTCILKTEGKEEDND